MKSEAHKVARSRAGLQAKQRVNAAWTNACLVTQVWEKDGKEQSIVAISGVNDGLGKIWDARLRNTQLALKFKGWELKSEYSKAHSDMTADEWTLALGDPQKEL